MPKSLWKNTKPIRIKNEIEVLVTVYDVTSIPALVVNGNSQVKSSDKLLFCLSD